VRRIVFLAVAAIAVGGFGQSVKAEDAQPGPPMVTLADGCMSQEGATNEDGKWVLPDGTPTFHVCKKDDGALLTDWYTYNGFRRYHDACHVCHGPMGKGSSFAPALAESLKTLGYGDFLGVVAGGRERKTASGQMSVMPAWGDNPNVMCYIDDLYLYLKARAEGAVPAIQLGARNREKKPDAAREYDKSCFGEG
jgi:methanol metabolism-related c-type cytochrome